MRATLVHNAKSGTAASEDELVSRFAKIGWKVDRCIEKKDLDDCLCHGADVVVVAGGDGTVAKVAKRLAGTGIPMAIVPMGTANNVARSLGIGVEPANAVRDLAKASERRIDLGIVHGSMKRDYFLEGFGLGIFAHVLAERARKKDKEPKKALELIADELETFPPQSLEIEIGGRDHSGKYVLVAVMNARSLGPALGVAPEAKCDDGELDVVLIRPDAKRSLLAHLRRAAEKGDVALPAFETMRAKKVRIRASGGWAHVDDEPREIAGETIVEVAAGAVKLLAPNRNPKPA
ncbi:MAG TPA: diacylglycerol kinase family protein [Polyangiaceae bacterium]|jgi:diacylglycerol kinase family enzyme